MSTSCLISKQIETNKFNTIYCHFDGYLDGVGRTLLDDYSNPDKVDALLSLGDISSLGSKLEADEDGHSFDNPFSDVVVAYHRDRGDPIEQTKSVNYTFNELVKHDVDFIYIMQKDNNWYVYNWKKKMLELVREKF